MPKKAMDYSQTIIYKLVCNDLNIKECYVGHTTNWKQRKSAHNRSIVNINSSHYNLKKSKFIRENGGWDNWSMIEIEKYHCNDGREARARERYWYEALSAQLNGNCPDRDHKTYYIEKKEQILEKQHTKYESSKEQLKAKYKDTYAQKKELIKERTKTYYKQNKEIINLRQKEKYNCECGSIVTKSGKSEHLKTLKHCQFIEIQKQSLMLDKPIEEIMLDNVEPSELTNEN